MARSRLLPILLLVLLSISRYAASETSNSEAASRKPLRFRQDGKFKILQVADMHYADGKTTKCLNVLPEQVADCTDLNTTAFIERMIAAEKPDLIVFTGDNIFAADSSNSTASLDAAFAPAISAKIPWAAVLGNHDQEGTLNREGVMTHIVTMKGTLSRLNPHVPNTIVNGQQHKHHIDGFGNYNLEVFGVVGSRMRRKSVLNLYFLDSGDYSTVPSIGGYGWIKRSQQDWYRRTSKRLRQSYTNGPKAQSEPAPGLTYFHIPLPELSNITVFKGVKRDPISSASINSGFFNTLVEVGDVKAVFTGHDHLNDFCGELSRIHFCYAGGFGYHAYGIAGWPRRARVVEATLDKDHRGNFGGVKSIETWKRLDDRHLSRIDVQTLWEKNPSAS